MTYAELIALVINEIQKVIPNAPFTDSTFRRHPYESMKIDTGNALNLLRQKRYSLEGSKQRIMQQQKALSEKKAQAAMDHWLQETARGRWLTFLNEFMGFLETYLETHDSLDEKVDKAVEDRFINGNSGYKFCIEGSSNTSPAASPQPSPTSNRTPSSAATSPATDRSRSDSVMSSGSGSSVSITTGSRSVLAATLDPAPATTLHTATATMTIPASTQKPRPRRLVFSFGHDPNKPAAIHTPIKPTVMDGSGSDSASASAMSSSTTMPQDPPAPAVSRDDGNTNSDVDQTPISSTRVSDSGNDSGLDGNTGDDSNTNDVAASTTSVSEGNGGDGTGGDDGDTSGNDGDISGNYDNTSGNDGDTSGNDDEDNSDDESDKNDKRKSADVITAPAPSIVITPATPVSTDVESNQGDNVAATKDQSTDEDGFADNEGSGDDEGSSGDDEGSDDDDDSSFVTVQDDDDWDDDRNNDADVNAAAETALLHDDEGVKQKHQRPLEEGGISDVGGDEVSNADNDSKAVADDEEEEEDDKEEGEEKKGVDVPDELTDDPVVAEGPKSPDSSDSSDSNDLTPAAVDGDPGDPADPDDHSDDLRQADKHYHVTLTATAYSRDEAPQETETVLLAIQYGEDLPEDVPPLTGEEWLNIVNYAGALDQEAPAYCALFRAVFLKTLHQDPTIYAAICHNGNGNKFIPHITATPADLYEGNLHFDKIQVDALGRPLSGTAEDVLEPEQLHCFTIAVAAGLEAVEARRNLNVKNELSVDTKAADTLLKKRIPTEEGSVSANMATLAPKKKWSLRDRAAQFKTLKHESYATLPHKRRDRIGHDTLAPTTCPGYRHYTARGAGASGTATVKRDIAGGFRKARRHSVSQ